MLAVGIDISKSKSVAAILNQDGSMHTSPFEFHHTQPELDAFIKYILNSNQPATILMENTGHYHYPVLKAFQEAGLPVCMVNAYQIKKFGDMDLRKAKTDKKDAVRIARYALEKSYSLVPYTSMEQKYEDLRFLARQYNQRMLTLKTNKVFVWITAFFCITRYKISIPVDILPNKWSDFDYWSKFFQECMDKVKYVIYMKKYMLDIYVISYLNKIFLCTIIAIILFFVNKRNIEIDCMKELFIAILALFIITFMAIYILKESIFINKSSAVIWLIYPYYLLYRYVYLIKEQFLKRILR